MTDSIILGGQTMRAHLADYSLLGSGERPWTPLGEMVDALDVADLESEAEHRYELLGARDLEEVAGYSDAPDGHARVDGGRTNRYRERFVAHLHPGERTRGVVRLESVVPTQVLEPVVPTRVQVLVGGGKWRSSRSSPGGGPRRFQRAGGERPSGDTD